MDIDIIKDNTLVSSLTDVQFQISKPYNENGKTYATLTVMRKSELIAKIKVLTFKDGKKTQKLWWILYIPKKGNKKCMFLSRNQWNA